jgi:hypothetical protein
LSGGDQAPDALLGRLAGSPDVCVQRYDLARDAALLVDIGASALRAASFLDDRVLTPSMTGAWVALGRIVKATQAVPQRPLHFIFHTGHVGSTLVSRLLDETRAVLPLREPAVLRQLADTHDRLHHVDSLINAREFGMLTACLLRLWSRCDAGARAVVLKATSSAGRIAPTLLAQSQQSRAIYLNLRAEPYIATLVAGASAAIDLRGLGPERFRRLEAYGATALPPLHSHSKGELAAAGWLAETWSQHKALDELGGRVLAVDFDALLGDVTAHVSRVVSHLGLPHEPSYLTNVGRSAVLQRYAKAPEHAYSPAMRAQILGDARRQYGEEIRRGLLWLEKLGAANPAVAAVCARAGL